MTIPASTSLIPTIKLSTPSHGCKRKHALGGRNTPKTTVKWLPSKPIIFTNTKSIGKVIIQHLKRNGLGIIKNGEDFKGYMRDYATLFVEYSQAGAQARSRRTYRSEQHLGTCSSSEPERSLRLRETQPLTLWQGFD